MNKKEVFGELREFYQGFYISDPVGNNAFSFDQRQRKEVYIPPLICGDLDDVKGGEKIGFSEVVDGKEKNSPGLESFIYWQVEDKDIFIFDNHNHAFSFWSFGIKVGLFAERATLVHVDQHKDTRQPDEYLEKDFWKDTSMAQVCQYANHSLNVGNFIEPALKAGMFNQLIMVDHEQAFEQEIEEPFIADIDLDIFSPEMNYIPRAKKVQFIRYLIQKSQLITIATSPHFIDQESAIFTLKELFNFS